MTRPMTRTTPMTPLFGVATLLLLCIASIGCTHPVLGRPALLGASVTSGAGAAVTAGIPFDTIPTEALARAQSSARDGSSVSVDAAVAFSAVVRARHVVPLSLGNGGVFIDPDAALREQVDAAAAWNPSVIIAVDWLFWPVHQAISLDIPTEQRAARRLASVDAALADLDQFHCPIVIGDVPQMTRAHGGLLRAENDPSSEVRAAANQRLTAWASARKNRFVLAVSQLADAVNAAEPFEVAGFAYARGESLRLVQRDGLHATPEGLVVLMAAAVECLCAHGLVDEEECRHEIADIALEMEREAIAAKDRSRPTLLESLSLSSMWNEFRERLDAKDDAGAAATLERVLNRLESFDRNPLGDDDDFISIAFSLSSLDMSFGQDPKTSAVYERHWRALSSDAKADAPHLWRFSLWLNYAQQLPELLQQETADALAARRESRGAFREPFAGIVWDDAQSIGDARTLARCFPEFDEAYAIAKERTASRLERTRTLKHDDPLLTVQLKIACEELFVAAGERVFVGLCTPFPTTRRPTQSDHSYLHKVTDSPSESNASAERIISRVDDINDPWAHGVELHNDIGLWHRKVGHGRGDRAEIAGMHARKFRFVEFVTYSHRESALEYRHIFSGRVPVWRNHGPRGGLLADHEGTGFSGVARYDRYLRAGDDRFPLQVIRGDDSMRICAACGLHCSD